MGDRGPPFLEHNQPGLAAYLSMHTAQPVWQVLKSLVRDGFDELPLPGGGRTIERWRVLAEVAAHDLSLAKLFEGHADALAILAELGSPPPPAGSTWGTWCAETPGADVRVTGPALEGQVRLDGRKTWCSGAATLTHGLLTARNDDGSSCLVAVALHQPGVRVTDEGWAAVGMAATRSVDVVFAEAVGTLVGPSGAYLARPGFWQGGAGVAACWYGGSVALGDALLRATAAKPDAHRLAHLGHVDIALAAAAATLREAAAWIDRHPKADARQVALRARLAVEHGASEVLRHAGRALGAGPCCRDARHARLMADLPVYLRQSHAERDLETLGADLAAKEDSPWTL